MKKLMTSKWRSVPFFAAAAAVFFGCFFLSDASGRSRRSSARRQASKPAVTLPLRNASYVAGSTTFATPIELTGHPPSPAFFQADAEPEVIVDLFGNIYATAIQGVPGGTDLWKSTNKGASFVYIGQPDGAEDHCNPPVVQCVAAGGGDDQIDVSSGGYLYVSSLWLGNVTFSTSYDGGVGGVAPGQKWEVNPAAADLPSDDRQWVAAYGPQTVYMSFATTALTRPPGSIGLFMTKSVDGGKTFPTLVEITQLTPLDTVNVSSNLVVDQYNGNIYTAYIPNGALNVIKLASSTDGGMTWNITTAYTAPAGTTNRGVFPILALDKGGNLHLVFTNSTPANTTTPFRTNSHVFLTSTTNPAALNPTWLPAVQVDSATVDPDTTTACEAWVVAGSPGVVDIAWLGTKEISTDQQPAAGANPVITPSWHVFFAQTTDALSGSPSFAQNKAETAFVHNHSICMNGLGCTAAGSPHGEPGNRDLLEYFRMALDPEGNANIVFADSVNNCDPNICRTNSWFTKQTGGTGAFVAVVGPPNSTFAPNVAMPNSSSDAEPSLAVDNFNCIYGTSPGNPDVWKSFNNGASFSKLPTPPVLPTGGGDEDLLAIPAMARPAPVYLADLALADVSIRKSTDGGTSWVSPGAGGAAGELNASSDRQWIALDFNGANQNIYEMDHELSSEDIRFASSTNDSPWVTTSGITDPGLLASTIPNTNPGPVFVNRTTHTVFGIFTSSNPTNNANRPPFGKLPDVWAAVGAGTIGAGVAPGPFTDFAVFKGVIDSPTTPAPPAGAETFGTNAANDFPAGDVDSGGNVYAAWAMNNSRTNQYAVWVAASHDGGKNFYGPFQISSGPGSAEMPWVAAGDGGRVNIVFYQSDDLGDPNTASLHWNVKMAQSFNGNAREPAFTVSQVSDHITHFGPICNQGLLCGSGTRVLLDFFEVAIGPDGLANIIYADSGNANAPAHVSFARQISGGLSLNNPVGATCLAAPSIVPVGAVSRKTHGNIGDFDVNLPITGPAGIECRTGGANGDHTVIISFANTVTVGSASVASADGQAMVNSFSVNGPVVTLNLTKVRNAQTITITLTNVSDGTNTGNVALPVGIVAGDTNASGSVNSADISQTKAESGKAVTGNNFREDLNIDGSHNSADITLAKSKSGTGM